MRSSFVFVSILILPQLLWAQFSYQLDKAYDIPVTGLSLGLNIGALALAHKITPLSEAQLASLDRMKVWKLDRGATYNWNPRAAKISNGLLIGSLALPFTLIAGKEGRDDFGKLALLSFQTFSLNALLTNGTKLSVRRTRPYAYNEQAPMSAKMSRDARLSFFSGHTSTIASMSFFFARSFQLYYPESAGVPYVWASAAAIPAFMGLLRVKAGKHFPTDVVVGYLAGTAIGILTAQLHQ